MFFERHVTGLYHRGASWEVQRKAGDSETFDAVVLTMPVPQILQLQGDLGRCESVIINHPVNADVLLRMEQLSVQKGLKSAPPSPAGFVPYQVSSGKN